MSGTADREMEVFLLIFDHLFVSCVDSNYL